MEYSEAIKIIRSNYPTGAGFTALKEALELAIDTMYNKSIEQKKCAIRCDCPELGCRGELVWTGSQTLSDTPYFHHECTMCEFKIQLDERYPQLK